MAQFGILGRIWQQMAEMIETQASRRELAELDDVALHDLGISRAQARFEADRAPWDNGPSFAAKRHARTLPFGVVRPS